MHHEASGREQRAVHAVGERRLHVLRVVEAARRPRLRHHRHGRRQVVREVEDVEQVRAPVAELPRAVVPARAPAQPDEPLAARRVLRGAEPERPVHVRGRRDLATVAVIEVAVALVARAGDPHVRLDGLAEQAAPQDVHRVLAPGRAHALVAHLRHQPGALGHGVEHRAHLAELLDERLLPVDVLAVLERRQHDDRVVVVRRAHDHAVELVRVERERLAEVAAGEGVRMLLRHGGERIGIHVAETREGDRRVRLELRAVRRRDAPADANLQELEALVEAGGGVPCRLPQRRGRQGHGRGRVDERCREEGAREGGAVGDERAAVEGPVLVEHVVRPRGRSSELANIGK